MVNSPENLNQSYILEAIERELKRTISEKYELLKEQFLQQLERDKAQTLSGITLFILKQMSIETRGENIVITLRTENK